MSIKTYLGWVKSGPMYLLLANRGESFVYPLLGRMNKIDSSIGPEETIQIKYGPYIVKINGWNLLKDSSHEEFSSFLKKSLSSSKALLQYWTVQISTITSGPKHKLKRICFRN